MGFNGIYPLVNIEKAIENGPVEIVDFPMKIAWWIFPWQTVSSPEGMDDYGVLVGGLEHECYFPQWLG